MQRFNGELGTVDASHASKVVTYWTRLKRWLKGSPERQVLPLDTVYKVGKRSIVARTLCMRSYVVK